MLEYLLTDKMVWTTEIRRTGPYKITGSFRLRCELEQARLRRYVWTSTYPITSHWDVECPPNPIALHYDGQYLLLLTSGGIYTLHYDNWYHLPLDYQVPDFRSSDSLQSYENTAF